MCNLIGSDETLVSLARRRIRPASITPSLTSRRQQRNLQPARDPFQLSFVPATLPSPTPPVPRSEFQTTGAVGKLQRLLLREGRVRAATPGRVIVRRENIIRKIEGGDTDFSVLRRRRFSKHLAVGHDEARAREQIIRVRTYGSSHRADLPSCSRASSGKIEEAFTLAGARQVHAQSSLHQLSDTSLSNSFKSTVPLGRKNNLINFCLSSKGSLKIRRLETRRPETRTIKFSDPAALAGFKGPRLLFPTTHASPYLRQVKHPQYLHDPAHPLHPYIIPGDLGDGDGIPILPQIQPNYGLPRLKLGNMRAGIQVITVPTADTPGTTLYLHFDNKRYLVGQIGEGTQRACVQNGVSLKKVQDVLITGKTDSQSTGGLIGMILTLADVTAAARADEKHKGKGSVTEARKARRHRADDPTLNATSQNESAEDLFLSLYGPQNLAHSLATARRFVFRKGMPIKVHEIKTTQASDRNEKSDWPPTWSDENIKVWALDITPGQVEDPVIDRKGSPQNPRKRSFDEANGYQDREVIMEQYSKQDTVVHGVVADMFGSKWRMDTLVEKPLHEVDLPAKMWIRNHETNCLDEYTGPLPGGLMALPDPMPIVYVRNPWPGALVAKLPHTSPNKTSVSYILVQHSRRGKFDVKAAQALKIPHKSMYSKLASGQSVVDTEGNTITPDMVMGPDEPGKGVAVIDLPSLEYVQPLISRAEWKSPQVTGPVGAIVWILGPGVAASHLLQMFMKNMSHMEHIISSPDHCPDILSMDSASSSAIKLAAIDMTTFPVPYHDNKTLPQRRFGNPTLSFQALPPNTHAAQRGQRVQIEPVLKRLDDEILPPLDTLSLIRENNSQEIMDVAQLTRAALQTPEKVKEVEKWVSQIPLPEVEITTLGTGSALPSKYRNVSSTLVRVPGHGSYLFDAGENTLGQLRRTFNPTEVEDVLRDLRMIWISHLHADHHLGTVSVIKAWHQVVHGNTSTVPPVSNSAYEEIEADCKKGVDVKSKYLAVVSEHGMVKYLQEYSQVEDFGYDHVLTFKMDAADFMRKLPSRLWPQHANLTAKTPASEAIVRGVLGVADIQAVLVNHCHGAMAVSLTFPFAASAESGSDKPFKVSYSGDCRPSEKFAAIGGDSTVLIHEATFEDELDKEARAKRHSTVSEALGVGSLMRAKAVVLTHFSQRYSKIPVVDGFWGDRSKIETAIKGSGEEQDRLQGVVDVDEEDEIQPAEEEEEGDGEAAKETKSWTVEHKNDRPAKAAFFDKPLGPTDPTRPDNMKVVIAFDYMKFRLRDMPRMEALRPALAKLFEEDIGSETATKIKENKVKAHEEKQDQANMTKKEKTEKWKNEKAEKEKRRHDARMAKRSEENLPSKEKNDVEMADADLQK